MKAKLKQANICKKSLATLVTNSLANWLTNSSCLVGLIDVTLAFEDANSKLLDVVSVADVDAEERVGVSLVMILVTILKLKCGQDFELYFRSRLWGYDVVKILSQVFGQDS